ncbi:hypothetical protein ACIRBY_16240 [Streptomyces sp. NPDC096136]|uniref:hypothetical protein n=1 Tax=Streptomyces sp. NPDC096136 TaxID=3366076 RepID=UPI003824DB1F
MGRHKQHKPRRENSVRPSTEWFGTAFHSVLGMVHLDVRQSGNGIVITSSPPRSTAPRRRGSCGCATTTRARA